jgi:hypothetical protein
VTDHQPDDDFLSAARRAHGPISEDRSSRARRCWRGRHRNLGAGNRRMIRRFQGAAIIYRVCRNYRAVGERDTFGLRRLPTLARGNVPA